MMKFKSKQQKRGKSEKNRIVEELHTELTSDTLNKECEVPGWYQGLLNNTHTVKTSIKCVQYIRISLIYF